MLATLKFISLSPSLSLQGKNIISMLSPSPARWALTSICIPTEQKEGLSFISSEHSSSNYAEKLSSSNYHLLVIRCLVYDALALLPTTGESGREAPFLFLRGGMRHGTAEERIWQQNLWSAFKETDCLLLLVLVLVLVLCCWFFCKRSWNLLISASLTSRASVPSCLIWQ